MEIDFLAEAVKHLGEGVLITDCELDLPGPRIVFVNRAMCEMSGYSEQELIGQTPRILQGEATSAVVRAHMRKQLATGGSYRVELVNYRKDGLPYDAEVFVTPLRDSAGKRTHFVAIQRDITQRKQQEYKLRQGEDRLRLALQSANGGVWDWDLTSQGLWWSQEMYELFGVAPDTPIDQDFFKSLVQSEDWLALQQAVADALTANRSYQCDFQVRHPTRGWRRMHASGRLILDQRQQPTRLTGITLDVTERRHAEEAFQDRELLVHDREERLRAILNTASDAIITIDCAGVIQSVNESTCAMFGYTHAELVGANVSILMPAPFRDEHNSYLARYQETRQPRIIGIGRESLGQRKDGSTFPIGLAVSEVDHLGLFTGVIRDISDRVELQKQVLDIAAEEGRRIGHELHDNLQQELTGLGLLAQSLADALDETSQAEAKMAHRLADGINASARQVHLLARGLVPVEIDRHGLQAALADLATTVSERCGIRCTFVSDGTVEIADNSVATHLYRIAQEATNNAVKHGQANRIDIVLCELENNVQVRIVDNGIGINNQAGKQTGMGLKIMQYRAALIGASLQVQPALHRGTSVTCVVHPSRYSTPARGASK